MIEYEYEPKKIQDNQLRLETGLYHEGNKIVDVKMFIVFKNKLSKTDKLKLDVAIANHMAVVPTRPKTITNEEVMIKLNEIEAKLDG